MGVKRLSPDTFAEVVDLLSGGRKLVVVDETGIGYFDLLGDGELPKPFYDALQPVSLGTIQSWMKACDPAVQAELFQVWKQLIAQGADVLTIARAIRWGIQNHSTEFELLERMGAEATQQIRAGRSAAERGITA